MFEYLRDFYGQNPLVLRPLGIQYLVHQQNSVQQRWLVLTTGDTTPLSCRGEYQGLPPASRTRNERRRRKKAGALALTVVPNAGGLHPKTGVPPSVTAADMDDPMPGPDDRQYGVSERSYLGDSPPPEGSNPDDPMSPAASLTSALDSASRRSPRLWAPGARMINGRWPTKADGRRTRMPPNDTRVSRFAGFIAPAGDRTSPDQVRFLAILIRGFSVFGLYERHIQRGQWVGDSLPLEHYPFECDGNLGMSQVFSWAHQHRLVPNSPDALAMFEYTNSECNRLENNTRPGDQQFAGMQPQAPADMLNWPDRLISDWRLLRHGPVRRGVSTTYPQLPGTPPRIIAPPAATPHTVAPLNPPPSANTTTLTIAALDIEMKPAEEGKIPENGTPEPGALITSNEQAPESGPMNVDDALLRATNVPLPEDGDDWESAYGEGTGGKTGNGDGAQK
ncbi:hypothetical protein B0H16DRAFT_1752994 [Mycena metata]|uniref:Uncharacterized protein n=1 Tax=Mycena metata TaxID=1033252 RepID=A0AAD7DGD6_9AGAR|nr:hypothetical protein B0H16DRAFT_1752994 [Mycena metata]